MTTVLLWLAILGGLVFSVAVIRAATLHRGNRSQSDADPSAIDIHGSNANFGNSLKGENSDFGRGFYDE